MRCAIIPSDIILLLFLLLPVTGSRHCSIRRIIRIGMHVCNMQESPLQLLRFLLCFLIYKKVRNVHKIPLILGSLLVV